MEEKITTTLIWFYGCTNITVNTIYLFIYVGDIMYQDSRRIDTDNVGRN